MNEFFGPILETLKVDLQSLSEPHAFCASWTVKNGALQAHRNRPDSPSSLPPLVWFNRASFVPTDRQSDNEFFGMVLKTSGTV